MELKIKTMAIEDPAQRDANADVELRPAVLDAVAESPRLPERTL